MTQLILAYNFPAKHLAKLRMAAMKLGVPVRPVEKREYLQSLGSFTGALGADARPLRLFAADGKRISDASKSDAPTCHLPQGHTDRDESGLELLRAP